MVTQELQDKPEEHTLIHKQLVLVDGLFLIILEHNLFKFMFLILIGKKLELMKSKMLMDNHHILHLIQMFLVTQSLCLEQELVVTQE